MRERSARDRRGRPGDRRGAVTGAELKAWREARGWTMEQMKEHTGYAPSQLSRWERGRRGRLDGDAKTVPRHVEFRLRDLDRIAELEARLAGSG